MECFVYNVLRDIFPTMESDKLEAVKNTIIEAGVLQECDLQWRAQEDLGNILPPIQVRKLIGSLKAKYGKHFSTSYF